MHSASLTSPRSNSFPPLKTSKNLKFGSFLDRNKPGRAPYSPGGIPALMCVLERGDQMKKRYTTTIYSCESADGKPAIYLHL